MTPLHRRNLVFVAAAFALGGLANLIFGQSPGTGAAQLPPEAEWKMPGPDVPDLAVLDAGWEARAPWGAAPKPPEAAATPPPPPPAPVGIVRGGKGAQEVIFLVADVGTVRVAPGESLPDGGRLLRVSGMRVTWIDGDGQEQQREMFIDPPRALPGSAGASVGVGGAIAPVASARAGTQGQVPPALANLLRGPAGGPSSTSGPTQSPRGAGRASQPAAPANAPAAAPATGNGQPSATPGSGTVTTVSAQSLRKSPAGQSNRAAPARPATNNPLPGGLVLPPGNQRRPATPPNDEAPRQ